MRVSSKNKRSKIALWIHRTAAPLLGLQILLWLVSGLGFALIPLDEDQSVPEAVAIVPKPVNIGSFNFDLRQIRNYAHGKSIQRLSFETRLGKPVIRVDLQGAAEPLILDAAAKKAIPRLTSSETVSLAGEYLKHVLVKNAELLWKKKKGYDYDYWGEYPVWRVDFDNWKRTRLYLSPYTGELLQKRNISKTLYDWCWSLHTFGYVDNNYYHNIPLILAAVLGLVFSLAGAYLFWAWWSADRSV